MTTLIRKPIELEPLILAEEVRKTLADNAKAVDKNELPARYGIELLGSLELFEYSSLLDAIRAEREIAREDLSVAFGGWAQLMVIRYLEVGGTPLALKLRDELLAGTRPGVTAMAPSFKTAAGGGSIPLAATKVDGGYSISGKLNWASNLAEDSVIVSSAETADGERFFFVVEGNAEGLDLGKPFGLLGLNATSSSWITIDGLVVPEANILSRDFFGFLAQVRPALFLLQTSECLGVAESAIAAASTKLTGMNEVFADDVYRVAGEIEALIAEQEELAQQDDPDQVALIKLRLAAAQATVDATALEVRTAGGSGYAFSSPASRRFREATFLPVQSPNEAQLKWQLEKLGVA